MPVRVEKPRHLAANERGQRKTYFLPHWLQGDAIAKRLLELRKEYKANEEAMRQLLPLGRFFKDEMRYWNKMYRAVCLLIPWVCAAYPGDCKLMEPYRFPEELHQYIENAANAAYIRG